MIIPTPTQHASWNLIDFRRVMQYREHSIREGVKYAAVLHLRLRWTEWI